MTQYEYNKENIKKIIEAAGISNRKFCNEVGLSKGTFWRLMYRNVELSGKRQEKVHAYAKSMGLDFIAEKSIWKRIVDFIKG